MGKVTDIVSRVLELGLSPVARQVRRERLTYLHVFKLRRIEAAMRDLQQRKVAGDFLEFSVALGGSSIILAEQAGMQRREFHKFDVFSTIQPPASVKDDRLKRVR